MSKIPKEYIIIDGVKFYNLRLMAQKSEKSVTTLYQKWYYLRHKKANGAKLSPKLSREFSYFINYQSCLYVSEKFIKAQDNELRAKSLLEKLYYEAMDLLDKGECALSIRLSKHCNIKAHTIYQYIHSFSLASYEANLKLIRAFNRLIRELKNE